MVDRSSARLNAESAASLLRTWSRRYVLTLVAVAALVVVHQAIVQPLLLGLSVYPPKINLAGRQRMLSQRIAKEALALATLRDGDAQSARGEQLLDDLRQWEAVHRQLSEAEPRLGKLGPTPIESALRQLDAPLDDVATAAKALISPNEHHAAEAKAVQFLLDSEASFLTGMERVVALLEEAADRELVWLRASGLAIMAALLLLLSAVYFAIIRPATALIHAQLLQLAASELEQRQLSTSLAEARDELEERVNQRTSELSSANAALASEIAERQVLERRMRDLAAQLAHAARITALGQLATGLAHEINQPLASIVSYADTAELLLDSRQEDQGPLRGAIAQIKQAALRAGSIVRRMRNFVRRGSSQTARVDLNELIREMCDLCRPQLEQGDVQLVLQATRDPLEVEVDAIEIQQVLVNLIQNALQALDECARECRQIQIQTSLDEDKARVTIADNGRGFAPARAEDAFAPFFSTKAEGLGMGLAISRSLLERYRGELTAENRPEGGARVVLCLPLASTHEVETGHHADSLCR